MRAGGDLRDDAAIGRCACALADHRLREDAPVARHQRGRGIVARGFEAEDQGSFRDRPLPIAPRLALGVAHAGTSPRDSRIGARAGAGAQGGGGDRDRAAMAGRLGPDRRDHDHRRQGQGPAARRDRRQGLWTKELDRALLEGEVDFCVHSMKDVESIRPKEIHIAAVRPRGDVRDRIVGAGLDRRAKQGAMVGTSSPRRKAQLLRLRPDLKIVPLARQCRNPAEERSNRARSMRPCCRRRASSGSTSTPARRSRPR